MPKLRKGELKYYKSMNPSELNDYVLQFPKNTEYVKSFLKKYTYIWVKQEWKRGKTI